MGVERRLPGRAGVAREDFEHPAVIPAGGSEQWSFDLLEAADDIQIRVDTGRTPHLVAPNPIDEILIDEDE